MRNGLLALVPVTLALAAMIAESSAGAPEKDTAQQGPIKVMTCQTISQPGSYRLANNIETATGDCLVITASFVSIDLAGFSISADDGGAIIVPPSSGQLNGIGVRNGSVIASDDGVYLGSAFNCIVEGLRVYVLPAPGGTGIVASGIVRNNVANGGHGGGISATGIVTGNIAGGGEYGISAGAGST